MDGLASGFGNTCRTPGWTGRCLGGFLPVVRWLAALFWISWLAGCGLDHWQSPSPPPSGAVPWPAVGIANPFIIPGHNAELVWNQVVDTIDDYFKIEREERVRLVGNVWTAGRIDTFPVAGATILEPWRSDSSPGFERLHSTLQSVRRRAVVHVVPVEGGFSIEVIVLKELEDLDHPQLAAVGAPSFRHDGEPIDQGDVSPASPITLGWIPQGRDFALEQQILSNIKERLIGIEPIVQPDGLVVGG